MTYYQLLVAIRKAEDFSVSLQEAEKLKTEMQKRGESTNRIDWDISGLKALLNSKIED